MAESSTMGNSRTEISRWVNACTSVIQVVQFGGFFEFSAMYTRHTCSSRASRGRKFQKGKKTV